MRILMVGDTHGVKSDIWNAAREAGNRKIKHMVVLGDFGLWTHKAEGHEFLDECQEAARANDLQIFAIGGNHENWDHWEKFIEFAPTHKGFGMVRHRVFLAPKVHKWTWANKTFVGAGGAVSIDKGWRLAQERGGTYHDRTFDWKRDAGRGSGARTLWWPNEELTDDDVHKIKMMGVKADYLFSHDCSNYTPFHGRLKPDPDSERHRRRIDEVLRAVKPEVHFHGHMHTKYDWLNGLVYGGSVFDTSESPTGHATQTYGLECNNDWNSWGVLDVEQGKFAWRGSFEKTE